jgi:hypothetical protein
MAAVKANATRPCVANASTSGHKAAKWYIRVTARAAMPVTACLLCQRRSTDLQR